MLESDKATVEVPSTSAGVVKSILINQGDDVTEGVALIEIEAEGAAQAAPEPTPAPAAEKPAAPAPAQQTQASAQPSAATSTATVEVTVPDIGVEKALVGEILVKVGDQIDVEQSIVVVESDKATVEVPSSVAGTVESIQVKEGDTVKEGVVLIQVKTAAASNAQAEAPATTPAPAAVAEPVAAKQETVAAVPAQSGSVDINVPDLGVDKAVVAEILVQVGDKVDVDQSLVVVESDKATVEVPSTVAGVVKQFTCKQANKFHKVYCLQQLKLKAKHLLLHQRQKQKQPQLLRQQHLKQPLLLQLSLHLRHLHLVLIS